MQRKNYAKVQFQQTLDLGYWCLGQLVAEGENEEPIEEWEMEPGKPMLRGSISSVTEEMGPLYDLRAVVTHYGRHENGHYICYRKLTYPPSAPGESNDSRDGEMVAKPTERWWRISDDDVVLVSEEYVLEQGGAFMLFYEQIDVRDINSTYESLLLPSESLVQEEQIKEPDEAPEDSAMTPQSSDNSSCNSSIERPQFSKDEVENSSKLSENDSTSDDGTVSLFSINSPESTTTSNTDEHTNDLLDRSTSYLNGVLSHDPGAVKLPLVPELEAEQPTMEAEGALERE